MEKAFVFLGVIDVVFIVAIVAVIVILMSQPHTRVIKTESGIVIEKDFAKNFLVVVETESLSHISHNEDFFDSVELGDEIIFVTKVTEQRFRKPHEATYFYTLAEYEKKYGRGRAYAEVKEL